jgi:protein-tyrosine phosphatase
MRLTLFSRLRGRVVSDRFRMEPSIHLELEGAHNFRDIGGFRTGNGGRVPKGCIYRSDALSKLSAHDLTTINTLNLRTIIDVRTPNERRSKPDRLPAHSKIEIIHIPIYPTERDISRFGAFMSYFRRNVDYSAFTRAFYHRIAFQHQQQIGRVIELAADRTRCPVLIHCVGGKDRTGFIIAIILLLLGVAMDEVIDDYLLTNTYFIPYLESNIRKSIWLKILNVSIEHLRPLFEARREYLVDTFDEIFQKYVTVEKYIETACGVSRETIAQLRSLYCTDPG